MNKIIIGLIILSVLMTGCVSSSATTRTLTKAGYTNIETGGWDVMGCSDDDFTATSFTATNSLNQTVSGTVCCGLIFKKCTIRY